MKTKAKSPPIQRAVKNKRSSPQIYPILYDLIEGRIAFADAKKALEEALAIGEIATPFDHLEGYRKRVAMGIAAKEMGEKGDGLKEMAARFERERLLRDTWGDFQLLNCYRAFSALLASEPKRGALEILQHRGGFTPIEARHRYSYSEVPLQPYHMELGVLLALLGEERQEKQLLDRAFSLARLQLNFLERDYLPNRALFTREKEANRGLQIGWSMLLFLSVGMACGNREFLAIAGREKAWLEENQREPHPLVPFIERHLSPEKSSMEGPPPPLMASFCFPEIAAVGRKEGGKSAISTFYGDRTGMGSLTVDSHLALVTFAPQHLPYDRCESFGITYSLDSERKTPSFQVESRERGYFAKGMSKITSKEPHSSPYAIAGNGMHSEVWIEASHEFYEGRFTVENRYFQYPSDSPIAFVFYLKAESCEIEGEKSLLPRTLDRYRGSTERLVFRGKEQLLRLTPHFSGGIMEVIPLAGDESFFGSDFLVGFSIDEERALHKWEIAVE